MKYFIGIFIIALIPSLFMWSCNKIDNYNELTSKDMSKPDPITNVKVQNFHGGAYITYDLPENDNLLYVFAKYKINNSTTRETKVSYFTDTLKVEGFEISRDYKVEMYAVSRANVMSDPVIVEVHPLDPAYLLAFPTLTINSDFGGIRVTATNNIEQPIGVVVISPDENGELNPIDQVYSRDSSIVFSTRGFSNIPRKFGIYITDHWGNRSDTLFKTITPLFEMELDKSKFKDFTLPSDARVYNSTWVLSYLWDNNFDRGYHTVIPTSLPLTFTFDLGIEAKLSRFKTWDRGGQYIGAFGNAKEFAVWGSNNPQDDILPKEVSGLSIGDVVGSWTFLGYFVAPPKPSGLPEGEYTADDVAWNSAGHDFTFSFDAPRVRYIRFQAFKSYGGGEFIHIMEASFWGQP